MEVQRIMESCISMAEDNRNKQRDSPIQFLEVMDKLLEGQNTSIDSFEALQQKFIIGIAMIFQFGNCLKRM